MFHFSQIAGKDIRDANMIVYRKYKSMDVSISVNTSEQYYQNIKVNNTLLYISFILKVFDCFFLDHFQKK